MRKSLRLLIDDNPEALDEVENDISFTYSGYAPISVRLVQCVAQKGGVLSNPANKAGIDDGDGNARATATAGKVQAHPIIGWKGFEDLAGSIPGETFDLVQRDVGAEGTTALSMGSLREYHRSIIHGRLAPPLRACATRQCNLVTNPRRPSSFSWVGARIPS
jgi:vacuolar protein sorting-associated protein 33A